MQRAIAHAGADPYDILERLKPIAARSSLLGKEAIAELAEAVMPRICNVIGGGSYSRHSPLGFWLEDVRSLGLLSPPGASPATASSTI